MYWVVMYHSYNMLSWPWNEEQQRRDRVILFSHKKGNELQVNPTFLATGCYPGGVVLERFYQQCFVITAGQSREQH